MPWRSCSLSINSRARSICCGASSGLRPNFTPGALRLSPGAGAFIYQAALKFGQEARHLPHGATVRVSVSICSVSDRDFISRRFRSSRMFYEVAQAAASSLSSFRALYLTFNCHLFADVT